MDLFYGKLFVHEAHSISFFPSMTVAKKNQIHIISIACGKHISRFNEGIYAEFSICVMEMYFFPLNCRIIEKLASDYKVILKISDIFP